MVGSPEAVVTAQAWQHPVLTPWLGTLTAVFRACEFLRSLVVYSDLNLLGEGAWLCCEQAGWGAWRAQRKDGRARAGAAGCRGRPRAAQAPLSSSVCLSQVFKFIYCCRLAEMGLAAQAFHYCEAIAKSVLAQPHRHSPVLLRQLVQVTPPPSPGALGGHSHTALRSPDPDESCTLLGGSTSAQGPWELWREKGPLAGGPRTRAPQPRTWHRGPLWAESWLWPQSPSFLLRETAHGALPAPSVRVFL